MDVLKGGSVQLRWTFSTSQGETFNLVTIDLLRVGEAKPISVAFSSVEFNIKVIGDYSTRKWTATRSRSSKEIVLNVKDAKTDDDGSYILKLIYGDSDKTRTMKLNVLGKFSNIYFSFLLVARLRHARVDCNGR